MKQDNVWKDAGLTQTFLEGVRGALPLAQVQIDVILRIIGAATADVGRVLDLGCGDGILGRAIMEMYPQSEAILLDFSQPMLQAATAKLGDDAARAHVIMSDYGERGWIDLVAKFAPFDVIVSGFSIHHQPDPRKREIYQELYDLLRPGGVFLNLEHVAPASPLVRALFDATMTDSLYAYEQHNGGSRTREQVFKDFIDRPDKVANILAPVADQLGWLREIGFSDVDCYFRLFEIALFGGIRPLSIAAENTGKMNHESDI